MHFVYAEMSSNGLEDEITILAVVKERVERERRYECYADSKTNTVSHRIHRVKKA